MAASDYRLKFVIDADGRTAKQELNSLAGDLNKLGGSFTASFGGAIPVAGAAAAAVATVGVAVFGVTAKLFELSKSASEFGSKIFDASQKTGLGAEALSAMKLAADQSDTSFEQVSKSVSKFSLLIDDAARGSKEATAQLTRLGLDPQSAINNLEGSLTKVFQRIQETRNPIERAGLASAAFGKKLGAELLPFIDQFSGDLPGLIKRAKELGATMTNENARAADEFGDVMVDLETQLASIGRTIGLAVMPEFTRMAREMSDWLVENRSTVQQWGTVTSETVSGVIGYYDDLTAAIKRNREEASKQPLQIPGGGRYQYDKRFDLFTPLLERGRKRIQESPLNGTVAGNVAQSVLDDDAEEVKKEAEKAAKEAARIREEARKRDLAAQTDYVRQKLQIERDAFAKGLELYEQDFLNQNITEEAYRENSEKDFAIYSARVKKLLLDRFKLEATGKTPLEIRNLRMGKDSANAAIDNEIIRERADREKTITAVQGKAADERKSNAEKEANDLIALTRAKADTQLAILDQELSLGILKEKDYARQIGQIHLDTLQAERAAETDLNRQLVLDEAIKVQKIRNAMMVKKAIDDETKAVEELNKEYQKMLNGLVKANQRPPAMGTRKAPTGEKWNLWELKTKTAAEVGQERMSTLKSMTVDTFGSMGDAIRQAITAWALYGDTVGAAMRKATAAILANVAAQSLTQALWETAQGVAMLAKFFFIPNPAYLASAKAHFLSAAIYGAIGAGSAIGAKAVGGGVGAGGGGGGRGSDSATTGSSSTRRNADELQPYSRGSDTVFDSGRRNGGIRELAEQVRALRKSISSMRPGDVLVAGTREKRGFIGRQVVTDINADAGTGRKLAGVMGIR